MANKIHDIENNAPVNAVAASTVISAAIIELKYIFGIIEAVNKHTYTGIAYASTVGTILRAEKKIL